MPVDKFQFRSNPGNSNGHTSCVTRYTLMSETEVVEKNGKEILCHIHIFLGSYCFRY